MVNAAILWRVRLRGAAYFLNRLFQLDGRAQWNMLTTAVQCEGIASLAIGGDDRSGEIALPGMEAGGGSRSVLERLYTQHWGELVRYVAAKFGSGPPDPEDVVQTAFARFATANNPAEIANERAFLYTTVRNVVLDHKRREATQERYSDELLADAEGRERCELTPERVLIEKERLGVLKDAMAKMPERRRLMFILSRYEGVSGGKIGKHFGVSEAAVRKQIKIAMRECMDALEAAEDGEPDGGSDKPS